MGEQETLEKNHGVCDFCRKKLGENRIAFENKSFCCEKCVEEFKKSMENKKPNVCEFC
jgi:predicted amidophosphoribosyltransferase